jgi:hypothetical protein
MAHITEVFIKKLIGQYNLTQITFSRMVELIDEEATKSNIEHILLTREILMKLHFDCVKLIGNYYSINRFRLCYNEKYEHWNVYIGNTFLTKVEFVHEWQNVYFALNGEELKLNDN